MNPTAIYSKSGKGVQEASGKTSLLNRGDRAVLSAIDGRATLADVAQKVGKPFDNAFQDLISKLDKDGYIREASPGTAPKPVAGAKPAAAGKPAAKPASADLGEDLDFSSLGAPKAAPAPSRPAAPPPRPAAPPPPPPRPAAPPPPPKPDPGAEARAREQQSALQKAREEAEAKAQAERDKARAEAEAKIRAETETKLRAEAEAKVKAEAEAKIRADAEAKAKAVRDAAVKAAAEARAKADAEAKARQEAERKAKEEIERAKKQAEEEARKAREEAERARKAAEEEARKAREEAEKARKEAERARKEAEEAARKAREEAERKAKEEAEAMRRQMEQERQREEQERAARRKREEEEEAERRKAREEEDRREEEERAARRKREREEEERSAAQSKAEAKQARAPDPAPKSQSAGNLDSLMADLDSFTTREEEERKEKEEAERKAQETAAQRAREEAERREREEAEQRKKEEARARKEEEKRRKREEEEELARKREKEEARLKAEEERRKKEADERERKAKAEEVLAAKATRGPAVAVGEDTDEVRKRMLGRRAGGGGPASVVEPPSLRRKKSGWGKPVAITLVLLLLAAVGAVHLMPVPTADYERAASEALGVPVKIGEAGMSLLGGEVQIKMKNIRIGDEARIASGAASPELASLRSEKKKFTRIELEGVQLPQEAIGQALLARVLGDNFAVNRVVVKKLELTGAAVLPGPLEADLVYGIDGALTQATVRGPDTLLARITPASGSIDYVVTASGFPLPFLPGVTLTDFGMKGSANPRGMSVAEWGGKIFGGSVTGTANLRWGSAWNVDGVLTARNINAAVFAPALLSEGKGEGTGRFTMSGAEPAKLGSSSRLEGNFTINSGVLGSFDLGRVIRTSGKEFAGRTQFSELTGQAVYDRGSVSLRNVAIGAGALNAGASVDIAQSGALTGRIVADVKSNTGRTINATVQLGGTVKEPQVRN